VGTYLLARGKEEGFKVYWRRKRNDEVDFVLSKGNRLTTIEVKSGRVKNTGGSMVFKKLYPHALALIVGSINLSLEDFLLGKKESFL